MQERVTFTPPPSSSIGSKNTPPPTSWFKENIIHFYQLKYAQELLVYLIDFLQRADYQTVMAKMQEGKLTFQFATLEPQKGSAEDIARVRTYNALQRQIGTEINYLAKFARLLKSELPQQSEALSRLLTEINQIARQFPRLSEKDIATLNRGSMLLQDIAKKAPLATKQAFWQLESEMLEKMFTLNDKLKQECDEELKAIQSKLQNLQDVKTQTTALLSLFSKGEVDKGWSQLLALLHQGATLPNDLQKTLHRVLDKLEGLPKKGGLSRLCADSLLARWVASQGTQKHSHAEWSAFIEAELAKLPEGDREAPFLTSVKGHIRNTLRNPSFPEVAASVGPSFTTPDRVNEMLCGAVGTPDTVMATTNEINAVTADAASHYSEASAGLSSSSGQLGNVGSTLGGAAATSAAKNFSFDDALPHRFAHVILDEYMPHQQDSLLRIAELLAFANMGADIGNLLLNDTLDFASAATTYNFSNSLRADPAHPGTYNGDGAAYQKQLDSEKQKIDGDIKNLTKIQQDLTDSINRVKASNGSPQAKAATIKQLQDELDHCKAALTSATALQGTLASLKITPNNDPKNPQFTITGEPNWQQNLSNAEGWVINGKDGSPGLPGIAGEIDSFQKEYGSQSQTEQMNLQLTMTEVQQEWTVVSTAMQTLNQSYMTISQGIYK